MREADFNRLFDEYAEPLFAYVLYRTGDRAMSEDIVSGAFERAYQSRRRFDRTKGGERSWLYAITRNLMLDELRRRDAERRAVERSLEPGEATPYEAVEAKRDIQEALRVLNEEEREAIALRFGADLSLPEIAQMLDLPLTTVEGRVYRALRKMREKMDAGTGD